MKLFVTKGWTGEQELISEEPTEQDISKLLNSLDWQDFNSVQLQQDKKNFLNVSGNISPDGLSIFFEEHGTQYVSKDAPETISQLEKTLKLYFRGDMRFKNFGFSSEDATPKPTLNKKSGYDLWKVQYEAKQKIRRQNHRIAIVATLLIVGLFGTIFYLWFNDELKFIGHDTELVVATVTEIQLKPGFKGNLYQQVKYEFEFRGEQFNGYFKGTQVTGRHRVGDLVKIKVASDEPSISKRVATLNRK